MSRIVSLPAASLLCVVLVLSLSGPVARACTTPVYRYALDNWSQSPYVVLHFHAGEISEQDKALNEMLAGLAEAKPPTNVLFYSVERPKETAEAAKQSKDAAAKKEGESEQPEEKRLGENEMRFDQMPKFVKKMYQAHVDPGSVVEGSIQLDLADVPELANPLPPQDSGRIEVAPPKEWVLPPRSSKFIVRFRESKKEASPVIQVTAEDYKPMRNIGKRNASAFAKLRKEAIKAEGTELTKPVTPLRVGDNWGIAYMTEEERGEKTIEQMFFETVADGRKYTYELSTPAGDFSRFRPQLFAVIGRTKLLKRGEAEPVEKTPKLADDASFYLMITPWQTKWYAGSLDKKTARAMIDSPARRKLGKLLTEGYATVLVVLPCEDEKKNKKAAKALKKVIAQIDEENKKTEKEIKAKEEKEKKAKKPEKKEKDDDSDFWMNEPEEPEQLPFRVATLTLSRTDKAEKWFVDTLMKVESDLNEYTDSPMAFAVFGRGLAMPPYIGEGITEDNLNECMFFLAGPCSCQVKNQNPGMDLLMKWDWEATAEAIAEAAWKAQKGTEEGEEIGYEEVAIETTENPPETTPEETTPEETTPEEATPEKTAPGETAAPEVAPQETPKKEASKKPIPLAAKPAMEAPEASPGNNLENVFRKPPPAPGAKRGPQLNSAKGALSPEVEAAAEVVDKVEEKLAQTTESLDEKAAETAKSLDPDESFAAEQAWKLGLGLALVAVVVFAVGFTLMRHGPPA